MYVCMSVCMSTHTRRPEHVYICILVDGRGWIVAAGCYRSICCSMLQQAPCFRERERERCFRSICCSMLHQARCFMLQAPRSSHPQPTPPTLLPPTTYTIYSPPTHNLHHLLPARALQARHCLAGGGVGCGVGAPAEALVCRRPVPRL